MMHGPAAAEHTTALVIVAMRMGEIRASIRSSKRGEEKMCTDALESTIQRVDDREEAMGPEASAS